jgi:hypothetical protein
MRYFYQIIASAGLAMVLIPSILHYLGRMDSNQMKTLIFLGTMLWFAGAIPWLGRKKKLP